MFSTSDGEQEGHCERNAAESQFHGPHVTPTDFSSLIRPTADQAETAWMTMLGGIQGSFVDVGGHHENVRHLPPQLQHQTPSEKIFLSVLLHICVFVFESKKSGCDFFSPNKYAEEQSGTDVLQWHLLGYFLSAWFCRGAAFAGAQIQKRFNYIRLSVK